MKSGFGNLAVWVVVLLVALSAAWAQGPAQRPQMTPAQALQVIGNINPHFEGSIEQINEQRELQFQAFQVLKALVIADQQYGTVEKSDPVADKEVKAESPSKKKRGK